MFLSARHEGDLILAPSLPLLDAGTPTEQALRASELRYRRLFESARDGILILDVEKGRVIDVNPFLVELLGFSHAEMVGHTVAELSPFKDMESNQDMLEQLQLHGYVRYEDLPLETKDGRHIAVEFVSNVYQAGGKKVIQCNIRDITERKRSQDEIHRLNAELEDRVIARTAQLNKANEELEAFSYSISHDLRAPLRHIMSFAEHLHSNAAPVLSAENLASLEKISRSAVRMGNLIDALLAFSRLGQSELRKTQVNMAALVRETLADFDEELKGRNILFEINALPIVMADRDLMRQAIVNLISNAVKFTANCPRARIEIGSLAADGQAIIFVRDNGVGFDPKYVHKLFGVFQRLHSENEFPGTGIGLANVQRIVQRHGGTVWAEASLGGGAAFYFSIGNNANSDSGKKL